MSDVTYDWRVESTTWDAGTGGVSTVHWRVSATDGVSEVGAYGSLGFSPDPDGPEFIPLEDLSEAIVVSWVQAHESLQGLEDDLARQLEKKRNPTEASGLPWEQ